MFNSVKKVNISAANIRTNFQISKYFCGNLPWGHLPWQIILANCIRRNYLDSALFFCIFATAMRRLLQDRKNLI